LQTKISIGCKIFGSCVLIGILVMGGGLGARPLYNSSCLNNARYEMKKILLVITVFILPLFVWNCDTNEPKEITDDFSDEVVKSAVYNGPKYPADFYNEGLFQAVLNYIRESDVLRFTEPSTSNYGTALGWVNNRVIELSFDTTNIIDGQSNEKYFEFHYPQPALAAPIYIFRVHKSSYFEGVEFSGTSDMNMFNIVELGIVNYRPFTLQFVKEFFDQLWFYKHYNMGGAVVLKRTVSENLVSYRYMIYFTHTVFGDYGLRDKIRLFKGEFELNKSNGTSQINYTLIKEVLGNSN
jgi:hypothetical protein